MILVDTSAWIEFFRGRSPVCDAVDDAIDANEAALCGPIVTELRRGFRTLAERRRVTPLLAALHQLSSPPDLWEAAGDLGFTLARKGVTVKTLDLLIATYALAHGVSVLTRDTDFVAIQRAGVGLTLA